MTTKQKDPLHCDTVKGCEIPGHAAGHSQIPVQENKKPIRLIYFTDPICSACWSIEPQLRKLLLYYGDHIHLEYHMGGLLPSWEVYNGGGISKPSDVAHHWEEMTRYSEMPIDGDLWLEDPLNSSYPPCMAYKAAELQGQKKAADFLRRMREMVFMEKKNIAKWDVLQLAASQVGLDTATLLSDYKSKAPLLFQADLQMAGQFGVRGFPALYLRDSLNNQAVIYGISPYENFVAAVHKLQPGLKKKENAATGFDLFNYYPTITTKEYSLFNDLSVLNAAALLQGLYDKQLLEKQESKNGPLWKKKERK